MILEGAPPALAARALDAEAASGAVAPTRVAGYGRRTRVTLRTRGLLIAGLLALASLALAQGASAYTCYWNNSACGFGGIGASPNYRSSPVPVSSGFTDRPFMNNQTSGTRKAIDIYAVGSYVGRVQTSYPDPQIWVANTGWSYNQAQYVCINISGGAVSVNCGYYV